MPAIVKSNNYDLYRTALADELFSLFGVRIPGYSEKWQSSGVLIRGKSGQDVLDPHYSAYFLACLYEQLMNHKPRIKIPLYLSKGADAAGSGKSVQIKNTIFDAAHSAVGLELEVAANVANARGSEADEKLKAHFEGLFGQVEAALYSAPTTEEAAIEQRFEERYSHADNEDHGPMVRRLKFEFFETYMAHNLGLSVNPKKFKTLFK